MRNLYSFLLAMAFVVLFPVFVYRAIFKRKYLGNMCERLGMLPDELKGDARPTIWLHAVSVGEALSAVPLVKALGKRFPQYRIIVSTTTRTGHLVARAQMADTGGAVGFCFFPFDWKFSVRRALDAICPKIVILMESELWLNFLGECNARSIPVVVANGRISDRSFARSQKFRFFIRPLYELVTRFVMQSAVDAERAVMLGASAGRVIAGGNIKYDIGDAVQSEKIVVTARSLAEKFEFGASPLIVAGSTHDGEEEMVIAAFKELKAKTVGSDCRLLIAPRHPERFEAVARLLEDSGLSYARRSAANGKGDSEVLLLDSIGELAAAYRAASVVFVGGSLVPVGGHNILEPAHFAKPIIVGPYMHNFRDITETFLRRNALIQLSGAANPELRQSLTAALVETLDKPLEAQRLGENARRTVEENRGATARIVLIVAELIS